MSDIIKELDAKAWQSTRYRIRARTPAKLENHVCFRAAREIERLRKIEDAPAAEKGWRTFWNAFSDHLRLDYDQRTYGWHDLMNAFREGMDAVKRSTEAGGQ